MIHSFPWWPPVSITRLGPVPSRSIHTVRPPLVLVSGSDESQRQRAWSPSKKTCSNALSKGASQGTTRHSTGTRITCPGTGPPGGMPLFPAQMAWMVV